MTETIKINRAPVLTLWASVVAEWLGFDRETALTLGMAVAGLSAYAKGAAIDIKEPKPDLVREQSDRLAEGERLRVDLLGRAVPMVQTPHGLRAVGRDRAGNPAKVEKYLAAKFGYRLDDARRAMAELAAAHEPADLHWRGFRLYEAFRPAVPVGESGWGAKGELDLDRVRTMASKALG